MGSGGIDAYDLMAGLVQDPAYGGADEAGVELTALRNVRLHGGTLAVLDLAAGEITVVRASGGTPAGRTEAAGWRLIPASGEPHAHLDKALSAEQTAQARRRGTTWSPIEQ